MEQAMPAVWWKDRKLLTGVVLVVLSVILGTYGKVLSIAKFYEPIGFITGLSIWAFSWVLLFLGVFLVGWETVKLIQRRIKHHVKRKVKETYDYTKEISKKSYHHTKRLHRKGMDKIRSASRAITEKIK